MSITQEEFDLMVQQVLYAPQSSFDQLCRIIAKAAIAKAAIPGCNLVYIGGAEMKSTLSAFLTILHTADPSSVGGTLPDDAFYYQK